MAASAPHPQRVPRVDDLGLRCGEEEHDLHRLAVGPYAGLAMVGDDPHGRQPVGVLASAAERPLPAYAVAAIDRDGGARGEPAASEDGVRIRTDLGRSRLGQYLTEGRNGAGVRGDPARRTVDPCDLFKHLDRQRGHHLQATERPGHPGTEDAGLHHGRHRGLGQIPFGVGQRGIFPEHWFEALNHVHRSIGDSDCHGISSPWTKCQREKETVARVRGHVSPVQADVRPGSTLRHALALDVCFISPTRARPPLGRRAAVRLGRVTPPVPSTARPRASSRRCQERESTVAPWDDLANACRHGGVNDTGHAHGF